MRWEPPELPLGEAVGAREAPIDERAGAEIAGRVVGALAKELVAGGLRPLDPLRARRLGAVVRQLVDGRWRPGI